jgi:hypothetical protein
MWKKGFKPLPTATLKRPSRIGAHLLSCSNQLERPVCLQIFASTSHEID